VRVLSSFISFHFISFGRTSKEERLVIYVRWTAPTEDFVTTPQAFVHATLGIQETTVTPRLLFRFE